EYAWKNDLSGLKHHVFPTFGARPLRWLATDDGERAILSWLLELAEHRVKRDGTPRGTHTSWNTASTFRVMVRDAKGWKHIARNPFAEIKLGDYLPEKADKKPGWREEAF